MLYDIHAGGDRPIVGAYLTTVNDNLVWIPITWTIGGSFRKGKQSNLDINWDLI